MAPTLQEILAAQPDQLLHLVDRRHPDFDCHIEHWEFLEASYSGGREWIEKNIFPYHKEGPQEFKARKQRAYRFPHSREVVSLINKYVFKGSIERSEEADEVVKEFWSSATNLRRPIGDLMQSLSAWSSTFGRIWVVVDNNVPAEVKSEAERKSSRGRTYSYFLKPTQVYDFEYDQDGDLDWILFGEFNRSEGSPLVSKGCVEENFRIWTKEFTLLIKVESKGRRRTASVIIDSIRVLDIGCVPIFPADHITTEDLYSAPGLIEDVAYLDRAVANYLSNLDVIIQDQTFSQLAIPFQGLLPSSSPLDPTDPDGEPDELDQMIRMGTKRIFAFNAEGGAAPEFISPDPKQAQLIMNAITKIIGEIYHSIGMAGERTKQDNAQGIDNSSGVAKAYDFEKLNAMLAAKAMSLENIERNLLRFVMAWAGKTVDVNEVPNVITYPQTFDVRSLTDEMTNAKSLADMGAPKALRRMQMKRLASKMYPQGKKSEMQEIAKEVDNDWLEIDPAMLEQQGMMGGKPPAAGAAPKPAVPGAKKNRQGENNKTAPKK